MPETTKTVYTCDKLEGLSAGAGRPCNKEIGKKAIVVIVDISEVASSESRSAEYTFHSPRCATFWFKRFGIKAVAEIVQAVEADDEAAEDETALGTTPD